jgi:MFS family permease
VTAPAHPHSSVERLYEILTEEDDGSACETIPAGACTDVPRNFFLNAANGAATKLGEQLGSPSLVLPWMMDALGVPASLTGLLVPVRESMSLLPQLAVAGRIRRFEKRKWFWAGGGAAFGLGFLLMIPAALLLPPVWAGVIIVLLLALGSVGRGVSSVAFKDVLAKTVPQGRRGTLLALRAAAGGILTLVAGILLRLYVADANALRPYLVLLAAAGTLWMVGVFFAAVVEEQPGATGGARNALQQARSGLYLLRQEPGFRRFITARALFLSVNLAIPFYVLYARELTGGAAVGLSWFVIASGLAEVLSSPFWGRYSDRSSRKVMIAGGALALVTGAVALLMGQLPQPWQTPLVFSSVFLLAGFARAGVRLGRKTYLVDAAPDADRPLYVAVSNTLVGVLTLVVGSLGVIADLFSVPVLIMTYLALTALAMAVSWRMPEAEAMV